MVQSVSSALTFDAFVAQYGDDLQYELIDGELWEMEPTGAIFQAGT
jgi:Uma2 family endonuclease